MDRTRRGDAVGDHANRPSVDPRGRATARDEHVVVERYRVDVAAGRRRVDAHVEAPLERRRERVRVVAVARVAVARVARRIVRGGFLGRVVDGQRPDRQKRRVSRAARAQRCARDREAPALGSERERLDGLGRVQRRPQREQARGRVSVVDAPDDDVARLVARRDAIARRRDRADAAAAQPEIEGRSLRADGDDAAERARERSAGWGDRAGQDRACETFKVMSCLLLRDI